MGNSGQIRGEPPRLRALWAQRAPSGPGTVRFCTPRGSTTGKKRTDMSCDTPRHGRSPDAPASSDAPASVPRCRPGGVPADVLRLPFLPATGRASPGPVHPHRGAPASRRPDHQHGESDGAPQARATRNPGCRLRHTRARLASPERSGPPDARRWARPGKRSPNPARATAAAATASSTPRPAGSSAASMAAPASSPSDSTAQQMAARPGACSARRLPA